MKAPRSPTSPTDTSAGPAEPLRTDASPEASVSAPPMSIREVALVDGPERFLLYEGHPVVKNAIKIATRPIQEAYSVVEQVIVHREPGTCLIANFRMGKTTALNIIFEELAQTFTSLPVSRLIAKGHDIATEKTFFTDILTDFKHAGARSGTTSDKRTRVLNVVLARARQHKSDRYLFLVDEGQNWGEAEFSCLRDLSNDWSADGVTVITVIFSHPALRDTRALLLGRQRHDLVGRFLLSPREFRGIRDREELLHTLCAYDGSEGSGRYEYPPRSGICYSEFLMPQAWREGWRLQSEIDRMWSAFCQVANRSHRDAENIGMNWVSRAIRNFFFSQAPSDGIGFSGTSVVWLDCVEASGYEDSLV